VAATAWSADHPLIRRVLDRPQSYELFQLLHLIDRASDDNAPVGHQGPVSREALRLRPAMSFGFPAADIDRAEWTEPQHAEIGRLRVTTTFLGLYGSDSPLPAHFTEALMGADDDDIVRSFIDLFHHRILSFLFRCWTKYRYDVTFRANASDQISHVNLSLLGIGTASTADTLDVSPVQLFRYAGIYSQRPRSAAGLSGLLRDYFKGITVRVEQCVGRWLPIDPVQQNRLGSTNCSLGSDFLIGERIRDHSGKFRVHLGPVDFDTYTGFLPGGRAMGDLNELVRFYTGDPLDFDLAVTLRGDDVPDTQLGGEGFIGRLSWTTWSKSGPCQDQTAVFQPVAASAEE
jgi:type VI secretion system protein ImpH